MKIECFIIIYSQTLINFQTLWKIIMYAAFVCLTEAVFRKLYKMDRYANSN